MAMPRLILSSDTTNVVLAATHLVKLNQLAARYWASRIYDSIAANADTLGRHRINSANGIGDPAFPDFDIA